MKILVVDDSPSIRTVMRYIIKSNNWDLVEATSSEQAKEAFKDANDFDLVIVDHGSQNLHGLDVLKAFKDMGYKGKSIVVSLDDRERFIESAKDLGISGWLHKPFTNELFCRAIDHAMGDNMVTLKSA